ncbi:uncharacterized protein LOC131636404 [Vicia villosa]|uniref:uncharacterized protein LOC131636404 n=1 Tax=Vicia villosa TaxID=3911 RepID=UPI00273B6314|nr:uncharacterized protein LOC131636404 [Vicia villosa]
MGRNPKKNASKRSMEETVTKNNEEFPREVSGRSKKKLTEDKFRNEDVGESSKMNENLAKKKSRKDDGMKGGSEKELRSFNFRRNKNEKPVKKMSEKNDGMNGESEKELRRRERNMRKKERRNKPQKLCFEKKFTKEPQCYRKNKKPSGDHKREEGRKSSNDAMDFYG